MDTLERFHSCSISVWLTLSITKKEAISQDEAEAAVRGQSTNDKLKEKLLKLIPDLW